MRHLALYLCGLLAACGGTGDDSDVGPDRSRAKKTTKRARDDDQLIHFAVVGGGVGASTRYRTDPEIDAENERRKSQAPPDWIRAKANEARVELALGALFRAQRRVMSDAWIDVDGDGLGEPLFFGELLEIANSRGREPADRDAFGLRALFGETMVRGRVQTGGYVYQMFLPGRDGTWVTEADRGGVGDTAPDANREWRCYAWPVENEKAGRMVYFVNAGGEVRAARNLTPYEGHHAPPRVDAAIGRRSGLHWDDRYKGTDGGSWAAVIPPFSEDAPGDGR